MLLEFIKFLENVVIMLMPLYVTYIVLKNVVIIDRNISILKGVKYLVCSFLTVAIAINTTIFAIINIYYFAVLCSENNIDLIVKELGFLSIVITLTTLGIIAIHLLWKNIANKQLISGTGTLKERIKQHWNDLKEIKNVRRKRNISDNNS